MLENALLGQATQYLENYAPHLLYPVPRTLSRDNVGIEAENLPFHGVDIWNGYELSWLNLNGKPEIALAEFRFPCSSVNIVESKSLKLYLNSFNQTCFDSMEAVKKTIEEDLSKIIEGPVEVFLEDPYRKSYHSFSEFSGFCLDHLDISTDTYYVESAFLRTSQENAEEEIYSHLLKSNCLATGQPDWGSVFIRYRGPKIDHEGLLKYIISYRRHSGFAEHCVEQMFMDILRCCRPRQLTVYIRYTRRGGLDINPFRSNFEVLNSNINVIRQ